MKMRKTDIKNSAKDINLRYQLYWHAVMLLLSKYQSSNVFHWDIMVHIKDDRQTDKLKHNKHKHWLTDWQTQIVIVTLCIIYAVWFSEFQRAFWAEDTQIVLWMLKIISRHIQPRCVYRVGQNEQHYRKTINSLRQFRWSFRWILVGLWFQ